MLLSRAMADELNYFRVACTEIYNQSNQIYSDLEQGSYQKVAANTQSISNRCQEENADYKTRIIATELATAQDPNDLLPSFRQLFKSLDMIIQTKVTAEMEKYNRDEAPQGLTKDSIGELTSAIRDVRAFIVNLIKEFDQTSQNQLIKYFLGSSNLKNSRLTSMFIMPEIKFANENKPSNDNPAKSISISKEQFEKFTKD